MKRFVTREHEIEPVAGLPGQLPRGEIILWQGRPDAGLVARRVLKSRWIAGYFTVLAAWGTWSAWSAGQAAGGVLFFAAGIVALAAVVLGLIELYAWALARTTLYTVTTDRVVMRIGVALSMTFNLPFAQVAEAALRPLGGKAGSIAVGLKPGHGLSWLLHWPHVRAWRISDPQPEMICLSDAAPVSEILALAVQRHRAAAGRGSPAGIRPANEPMLGDVVAVAAE